MELFKAHNQWAKRPADERFESLLALYHATKSYATTAQEIDYPVQALRAEAQDGAVAMVGKGSLPAKLTHWSFGQLAVKVGAPASYLRNLPATLACQNLNHGLAKLGDQEAQAKLLFHQNGSLLLRSITSDRYERIWNYEVAERLLFLEQHGWEPARPDVRKTIGDFPSLYASDHDMFVFLRAKNHYLAEPGVDAPMWKGVIIENSEVGASSLSLTRFYYREMCGNHIIWGATKKLEIRLKHIGAIRERMRYWNVELTKYLDQDTREEELMISKARNRVIAATKEEVLDKLFGIRNLGLGKKVIEQGYEAVLPHQDGNPNSVWGIVQGLTRYSQTIPYTDERTKIDQAAGRIMTMVDAF